MQRYLTLLFLILVFIGCKHDSSTAPPPITDTFTLSISGTFNVGKQLLSVDKITVLLDGNELTSAECGAVEGCITLTVTANKTAVSRGTHVVDLRLDQQSLSHVPTNALQPYQVSGEVEVLGKTGVVQQIPLSQITDPFIPGQSAEYTINVNP